MTENNNMAPPDPANRTPHLGDDEKEFKSARTMVIAASIMGPVSMIIGGVPLSLVALILVFIGRSRLNKLVARNSALASMAKQLKRSCNVATVVCVIAFVLNAFYLYTWFPYYMEIIESGNFEELFSLSGTGGSSSGGSVW